ncbi:hypothetical protein NB559_09930 [Vibrio parahaemolyticus]|uniref:hypothetical protein n=1 Tax=Vibrio TaxID=662 RepID=UPI0002F339D3|nr:MULTISPECIES: hypothetical protein [Vibrio]EGR0569096.1 hypothetical protein [Vibrio cholerae]MBD1564463.1 hypothetical protein [Vibrio sp. S12_S33]MCR9650170.1 hypothetical protein [Vibrio parahaemolyticus]MCR9656951.1 hypothetical protein [Vibrio parahaemolyticus]OEE72380.1 hypothetical protein A1QQ_06765 [Vibrio ordalii FF-167]
MKKTILSSVVVLGSTLATSANAALVQADVDSIVSGVTADAAIAIAAGFSILAVVLGGRVGFGLVKSFVSSGAS